MRIFSWNKEDLRSEPVLVKALVLIIQVTLQNEF